MARIDSRVLFLTTSPRSPEKIIPEINLLIQKFEGQKWNKETQVAFMEVLREEQFFNGEGANDPALSARDRINRAPKSLGFVTLDPAIALTPAGEVLMKAKRKDVVFLRQMLKFQVPSPYHKPSNKAAHFCIKPFLEMLRLVRTMGTLRFDELMMFGMQLTHWCDYEKIVAKINKFREDKVNNHTMSYKEFKTQYLYRELKVIYADRIHSGDTKTRESNDRSLQKFLATQAQNLRDYADACFRYLRITGLVNVSHVGKSLSIVPERIQDVDYILSTVDRDPCFVDDKYQYIQYLGDATLPRLMTDDYDSIVNRIHSEYPGVEIPEGIQLYELKDLLSDLLDKNREEIIKEQIKEIKDYKLYDDIQNTFEQIKDKSLYDIPLMLEWNTWRAMTMLDGGVVNANMNFDDSGKPLSTAQGNMADIVCDYDDYLLAVEVTTQLGQKQYETEGEPVSRHLGKLKNASSKPAYGLFVAPKINEAVIAHFYHLHHLNISYYGGKSVIIPLPIDIFQKMLEDSYKADYIPNPYHVRRFFEKSKELAEQYDNEIDWYAAITKAATNWLSC